MDFVNVLQCLHLLGRNRWDYGGVIDKLYFVTRYTYPNKLKYTYPRACGHRGLLR